MADFLTRLTSRTLGLAPIAEPVIAPMFAPDPSLPAMTDPDELAAASQQAAEPMVMPGALRPVLSPESIVRPAVPHPRPDPAEARPAPPSAGELVVRAAAPAPDDATVRDIPTQRRPQRTPAASEIADADALLIPSAGALRRQSLVRTPTPAETPLSAQTDSPNPSRTPTMWAEARVAATGRSAARQGRAPSSQDVEPDELLLLPLNPVEALSMRPDARAAVTPVDEPELPRRAERGQAAAAATLISPLTIEVTIGRVEVRAMHPPAPVARPKPDAPTAPRLSLEEYLRNQNGGRR